MLEENYEENYLKNLDDLSMVLFPGDEFYFYNEIKEYRSRKYLTCDFSGGIIFPGSYYCYYRPLLQNKRTKERYRLTKTLKVECAYFDLLPTNMSELEFLNEAVSNECYQSTSFREIDLSHLSAVLGGGFHLKRVSKKYNPQNCGNKIYQKKFSTGIV